MNILLEFKPEDIIKVFKPFFSKPEYADKFSTYVYRSFEEAVRYFNEAGKNTILSWWESEAFFLEKFEIKGVFAIKFFSLYKKHLQSPKKQYSDLRCLLQASILFFLYSVFITAKIRLDSNILSRFERLNSINDFETFEREIEELYVDFQDENGETHQKIRQAITNHIIRQLYKPFYEDEKWLMYELNTYKEAKIIGGNTQWCVSSSSGEEHMNIYKNVKKMRLFALLSKKDKNTKYILALPDLLNNPSNIDKVLKVLKDLKGLSTKNKIIYCFNVVFYGSLMQEVLSSIEAFKGEYASGGELRDILRITNNAEKYLKILDEVSYDYSDLPEYLNKAVKDEILNYYTLKDFLRIMVSGHGVFQLLVWFLFILERIINRKYEKVSPWRNSELGDISYLSSQMKSVKDYYEAVFVDTDDFSFIFQNILWRQLKLDIMFESIDVFDNDIRKWSAYYFRDASYIVYEFADKFNEHISMNDVPEVYAVYKKALPAEYDPILDFVKSDLHSIQDYLYYEIFKKYPNTVIKVAHEFKKDLSEFNPDSKFKFVKDVSKMVNQDLGSEIMKFLNNIKSVIDRFDEALKRGNPTPFLSHSFYGENNLSSVLLDAKLMVYKDIKDLHPICKFFDNLIGNKPFLIWTSADQNKLEIEIPKILATDIWNQNFDVKDALIEYVNTVLPEYENYTVAQTLFGILQKMLIVIREKLPDNIPSEIMEVLEKRVIDL